MLNNFASFNLTQDTTQVLVTTAIGGNYFDDWSNFSSGSWLAYAHRHGIGIVVVRDDLISPEKKEYKNGSWQKMLAPLYIAEAFPSLERFCLLDTDIIISPFASNIFDDAPVGKFSVVSEQSDAAFSLREVKRKIAYFRHNFYSSNYPLDGFIHASFADEFRAQGLAPQADFFCAGVIVLDRAHAATLAKWFFDSEAKTIPDVAWEQTYLNYWIQQEPVHWLPYEYQALWNYEMAWNHPYLYRHGRDISHHEDTRNAVKATLWNNHFLHFAGSWFESDAWKMSLSFHGEGPLDSPDEFESYRQQKIEPRNMGKVLPAAGE